MKLEKFSQKSTIYIDSNIFLYVIYRHPHFMPSCDKFLHKVESGHIAAAISPLVIDEVVYKLIIEHLKITLSCSSQEVINQIHKTPSLLKESRTCLTTFLSILQSYRGLKIIPVSSRAGIDIFAYISQYNLLPRDALHFSTIQQESIVHIATNDKHFEHLPNLHVWKP